MAKLDAIEPAPQVAQPQRAQLVDGSARDTNRARVLVQARAVAFRAGLHPGELPKLLVEELQNTLFIPTLGKLATRVLPGSPFEAWQNALEPGAAVERNAALLLVEPLERLVEIDTRPADLLQHRSVVREVWLPPGGHRAAPQRKARVGHRQLDGELPRQAEAVTACAGAQRRVERKELRRHAWNRRMAFEAGVLLGEPMPFAFPLAELDHAAAQLIGKLDRLGETRANPFSNRQPVDDHVDRHPGRNRPEVLQID